MTTDREIHQAHCPVVMVDDDPWVTCTCPTSSNLAPRQTAVSLAVAAAILIFGAGMMAPDWPFVGVISGVLGGFMGALALVVWDS